MNERKYVVFQAEDGKIDAIMFPIWGTHSVMAARSPNEPISAGFATKGDGPDDRWQAWGRSITLDLGSRGEQDSVILNSPQLTTDVEPA